VNIHTEIGFLITKNNFCCSQNYEQTNRDLKYIYIKYIQICNEQLDQKQKRNSILLEQCKKPREKEPDTIEREKYKIYRYHRRGKENRWERIE
jgi:hypothetical protein